MVQILALIFAIQQLLPSAKFTSVEINKKACTDLLQIKNNHVKIVQSWILGLRTI